MIVPSQIITSYSNIPQIKIEDLPTQSLRRNLVCKLCKVHYSRGEKHFCGERLEQQLNRQKRAVKKLEKQIKVRKERETTIKGHSRKTNRNDPFKSNHMAIESNLKVQPELVKSPPANHQSIPLNSDQSICTHKNPPIKLRRKFNSLPNCTQKLLLPTNVRLSDTGREHYTNWPGNFALKIEMNNEQKTPEHSAPDSNFPPSIPRKILRSRLINPHIRPLNLDFIDPFNGNAPSVNATPRSEHALLDSPRHNSASDADEVFLNETYVVESESDDTVSTEFMEYFNLKHVANKVKNQIYLQSDHTTSIFKGINSKSDSPELLAERNVAEIAVAENSKTETVSNFCPEKHSENFHDSHNLSLNQSEIQGGIPKTSLSSSRREMSPRLEDFDKTERLVQTHQNTGRTKGERLALKEYLHRELNQLYPDSSEKRQYLENRLRELDDYDEYLNEGINKTTLLTNLNVSEIDEKFEKGVIAPILSSTPKALTPHLMNRFVFDISMDVSDSHSSNCNDTINSPDIDFSDFLEFFDLEEYPKVFHHHCIIPPSIYDRDHYSVLNLQLNSQYDSDFSVKVNRNAQIENDLDFYKNTFPKLSLDDALDEDGILKSLTNIEFKPSHIHDDFDDSYLSFADLYIAPTCGQHLSILQYARETEQLLNLSFENVDTIPPSIPIDDYHISLDSVYNHTFIETSKHSLSYSSYPITTHSIPNTIDDILTEESSSSQISVRMIKSHLKYHHYSGESDDINTAIERSKKDRGKVKNVAIINDILHGESSAFAFLQNRSRDNDENLAHKHKLEKEQLKCVREQRKLLERENARKQTITRHSESQNSHKSTSSHRSHSKTKSRHHKSHKHSHRKSRSRSPSRHKHRKHRKSSSSPSSPRAAYLPPRATQPLWCNFFGMVQGRFCTGRADIKLRSLVLPNPGS